MYPKISLLIYSVFAVANIDGENSNNGGNVEGTKVCEMRRFVQATQNNIRTL